MISLSSSSALREDRFLSVLGYFKKKISGFKIFCNGSDWNFKDFILAIGAGLTRAVALAAFISDYMLAVFEVKQCPQLFIAADDDMTSPAAITTIGSAFGCALVAVKMHGAGTACPASAHDLYIVNKITFAHL